ncbi:hypothetical protein AB0O87_02215 [Microbacterium sp. NPDC076768]|uniref:hypothetical protein n=1 Tax=Microbacterium sp. NPDC076768 TaxID=3154858 RepID=UPI003418D095
MSDSHGTSPQEPEAPEDAAVPDEPVIPSADDVIPPPPPEIPIPEGLLAPPQLAVASADDILPSAIPATRRGSDRPRPTPAILNGTPPSAVAEDWAQPSVAPEVPTTGGYRGFSIVIFLFLFLLLAAAVAVLIYLINTTSFSFASAESDYFAHLLIA